MMDFSQLHYYVPAEKIDNVAIVEKNLIIYGEHQLGLRRLFKRQEWVLLLQSLSSVNILVG